MTEPHRENTGTPGTSEPLSPRLERLATSRPFQFLFLLWLLLVNALYYGQFRDLLFARWPALQSLWPW